MRFKNSKLLWQWRGFKQEAERTIQIETGKEFPRWAGWVGGVLGLQTERVAGMEGDLFRFGVSSCHSSGEAELTWE